jgi:hypothetical protein
VREVRLRSLECSGPRVDISLATPRRMVVSSGCFLRAVQVASCLVMSLMSLTTRPNKVHCEPIEEMRSSLQHVTKSRATETAVVLVPPDAEEAKEEGEEEEVRVDSLTRGLSELEGSILTSCWEPLRYFEVKTRVSRAGEEIWVGLSFMFVTQAASRRQHSPDLGHDMTRHDRMRGGIRSREGEREWLTL